ncbi:MAG: hypothetical protein IIZ35_02005, partial [Clostridia bacterium]|nr:hypothetical protein [Clostridia bacterium]
MTFEKLKTVTREVIARAIDPDNEPLIQRVYYRDAPDTENAYPYTIYDFERDNTGDFYRDDVRIFVDIWDRSPNYKSVEQLGDRIDRALNDLNYPSGDILPTFFRENRFSMPDPDKSLKRHHMEFSAQVYEKNVRVHLYNAIVETVNDLEHQGWAYITFRPSSPDEWRSWEVYAIKLNESDDNAVDGPFVISDVEN